MNIWKDASAAWPVANPVVTCASPSSIGFPSNFVADPFLYVQVMSFFFLNTIYLFSFILVCPSSYVEVRISIAYSIAGIAIFAAFGF